MDNLVPESKMLDSRLAKFLSEIRDISRSAGSFRKKIDVDVGHIAFRGEQTGQAIRSTMHNEQIASVLLNGIVKPSNCRTGSRLELAVEGRFAELSYTAYAPVEERKLLNVAMRIIVRQGKNKHLVVTVYPLNKDYSVADIQALPEVPYEIW